MESSSLLNTKLTTSKWSTMVSMLSSFSALSSVHTQPHSRIAQTIGKVVKLPPEAEEVASFFAAILETDYVKNPTFVQNFFSDWQKVLKEHPPVRSTFFLTLLSLSLGHWSPFRSSCVYSWMEPRSKITRNVISVRFSPTWKRRKPRRRSWRQLRRNNWKPRKTSPRTSTRLVCWMGGKRKLEISGLNPLDCSGGEVNIQRRECWRYVVNYDSLNLRDWERKRSWWEFWRVFRLELDRNKSRSILERMSRFLLLLLVTNGKMSYMMTRWLGWQLGKKTSMETSSEFFSRLFSLSFLLVVRERMNWRDWWGMYRYVFLAAGSSLKGQSDLKKFEKARALKVRALSSPSLPRSTNWGRLTFVWVWLLGSRWSNSFGLHCRPQIERDGDSSTCDRSLLDRSIRPSCR